MMKKNTLYVLTMCLVMLNTLVITAQNIELSSIGPLPLNGLDTPSWSQDNTSNNRAPIENIYTTDPFATTFQAQLFSSPSTNAPRFGDKIRFDNATTSRLITQVQVGLFHNPPDPKFPITLEISMYSDCPAPNSNTQGLECGTGPGTLIPGSTMTLPNFLPVDGAYLRDFNFPTPVNVYGYGDEITVVFKAISAGNVYMLTNTPIVVGSNPLGEPAEGRYSGCGELLFFSGCDFRQPAHLYNNILLNVIADADNTAPTAQCQNITATLHPILGTVNVPASAINNGSFDAEGSVTLASSKTSFNCSDVGPNTVTLTVTDRAGFTSTCTATVTIQESPIVMGCPADKVFEANNANCTYQFSFSDIITGNQSCNPVTITQIGGPPNNSFLPLGDTVFTYQGTTPSGLTTTCSYTVTIVDTTPPVITNCPSNITVNAGPGACGAVVNYTAPTVNDSCLAFFAQVQGLPSGSTFPVGTTTNTWVANDFGGGQVQCSFTVTVVDTTPPSITCNFSTVNAQNDPGQCSRTVISTAFNPIVSDNCTSVTVTNDFNNTNTLVGAALPVGQTTVTWTAEDTYGNTSTCATTFFVNDAEDPQISCSSDITVNTDPGTCGAIVTFPDPSVSDNCGISDPVLAQEFTFTGNMQTFTVPIGVTSINIESWGAAGQDFTIQDFDPSIGGLGGYASGTLAVTPGQVIYIFVGGQGTPGVGGFNGGSPGGFGNPTSGSGGYAGSGGGASDVRLGGTDLLNRIIVAGGGGGGGRDYVNGTCLPCGQGGNGGAGGGTLGTNGEDPFDTIYGFYYNPGAGGKGGTQTTGGAAGDGPNGPPGNPGILGVGGAGIDGTQSVASGGGGGGYYGGGSGGGANNGSGRAGGGGAGGSSYTGGVLNGTTTPGVRSGNGKVRISWTSEAIIQTSGLPSGSTFPVGTTLNTFEVTDAAGNTATCSFNVTVNDTEAPTAVCQDITVQLDASGNATIVAADVDGGSTDACGIASIAIDVDTFDCSDVGANPVLLTVIDVNGNTGTCTAIVTVEDNVGPTAVCQDITIQLDASGNATIVAADVDGGSADACGIASLSIDVDTFDCSDVGANPVVLTVTDVNGNTGTCTATVTVEDNMAPMAVCQDITVQLDALGNATIVAADVDGGSTDACGIASLSIDVDTFDCSDVGTNPVVLTVTDVNGNSSTCTATVTVEDNVAPTAVCQDITVQLDALGNATIVATDVDGGSTDACGIASLSIDVDTFGCSDVGANPVVLTVTDVNGNSSTCTATVTVEDNVPPAIACPTDIVVPNDLGVCGAQVNFGDASAADACGIASVLQTAGLPSGSTFPVGTTTVGFTATDVNGNTSTCTFTVTVQDTELPVAVCQDITVQLDALGFASITAADIDGGSSDNCGVASISASQTDFDCGDVGDNSITLTVTDVNGNTGTCVAVVTVEDVTAPDVACMDITVILDVNGTATINGTDIDGGSSDACGIATYELDIDTFDCSNVGDNPVTLTVTDVNGNSASCTATVTVIDDISPDLVCMDITLELDGNGEASIVPEDVMASNTDACGILTTGVDIEDFSCADIGTPVTVTVFSQDNNGNLSSCTATVTVVDVTGPVISDCPADLTVDPGVNNLFYEVPDYWATTGVTATDNCTDLVTVFGQDPAPGTLLPDGTYTITLTAEDAYGNESSCSFELTVESLLGTQETGIDLTGVALYPNPAKDVVTLHNPQSVVMEQAAIYDLNGKLVRTFDLRGQETQNYTLDVSNLQMATYLVVIQTEKGVVNKTLIKG